MSKVIELSPEVQRICKCYDAPWKLAKCYIENYNKEECETCVNMKICQAINVLDNMF